MKRSDARVLRLALAVVGAVLLLAPPAFAVGTPSGTSITNQATVNFTDANGNALQAQSNVVTTVVSQVAGVIVDPDRSLDASPGDVVTYAHRVTNSGNGNDTIQLTAVSSNGWTVAIYHDVNGNGTYEPGTDVLITDTGVLAHDAFWDILVRVTVPPGVANGSVDSVLVTGRSTFNASVTESATDTTTIRAPVLAVAKSVNPAGAQPPGTVLTYQVVVTNNGSGIANTVVLTDPAPVNTTYVPASITFNGAGRTDAADGDNADFGATTANTVTVNIGTLAAGGGTATVTFQVRIN